MTLQNGIECTAMQSTDVCIFTWNLQSVTHNDSTVIHSIKYYTFSIYFKLSFQFRLFVYDSFLLCEINCKKIKNFIINVFFRKNEKNIKHLRNNICNVKSLLFNSCFHFSFFIHIFLVSILKDSLRPVCLLLSANDTYLFQEYNNASNSFYTIQIYRVCCYISLAYF